MIDGWMIRRVGGPTDRMDGLTDRQMDGKVDGRMHGSMYGWTAK